MNGQPPKCFLRGLCHNVEGAHDISVVKNSWNWNFVNFGDLVLVLPEAATEGVL